MRWGKKKTRPGGGKDGKKGGSHSFEGYSQLAKEEKKRRSKPQKIIVDVRLKMSVSVLRKIFKIRLMKEREEFCERGGRGWY